MKTQKQRHWRLFLTTSKTSLLMSMTSKFLMPLSLTLNLFYIFFWCLYCWLWTGKYLLGSGIVDIELKKHFRLISWQIILYIVPGTGQLPSEQLPPAQLPPRTIAPRTIAPRKIATYDNCFPDNYSLDNCPGTIPT